MNRLNLFAPEVRANPYPHYAALRRDAPVSQVDPGGVWAVSRYDDIVAVLKNPQLFSSQGLRSQTNQPWVTHNPIANSVLLLDPPLHAKKRALVSGAFGSRVLPRIEPLARTVAAAFTERARAGGEIDVSQEIAAALPAGVIANLIGLDQSLCGRFRAWTDDLVAINPSTPPEAQPRIRETIAEIDSYFRRVIAERRAERQDDLVSDLLDAEVDGEHLEDEEIVSFLFLIFAAGFETTSHLITNALRVLADRPALVERLRAEPAAIPAFIEEVLRFDAPVHGTMRLTTSDTELCGVHVPRGAFVLTLLGSALRDESKFEDPDRFDIDRKQAAVLAFGHGIHYCLGAALARAEARIAFEELLRGVRGVHRTSEPVWNLSMLVRGPLHCNMKFDPA